MDDGSDEVCAPHRTPRRVDVNGDARDVRRDAEDGWCSSSSSVFISYFYFYTLYVGLVELVVV